MSTQVQRHTEEILHKSLQRVSIQKIMMRRNSGRLADHNRDVNLSYQTHHLVFLSVSPNLGPTYHLGEYKTDFPFLASGCFASGNCLISLVSSCDIPAWNILSCRRVKRRLSVKRGEGMGVLGPFQDEEDIRPCLLNFPTRWSLLSIFGFLYWSPMFQITKEIYYCAFLNLVQTLDKFLSFVHL